MKQNVKFIILLHHVGDHIVSAEKVVDFYMKGRLSQYHDVGKYPGKIETSLVLFAKDSKFKGAVVVGLGIYGELNEEGLTRSFRHALIDYAMSCMDMSDEAYYSGDKNEQKRKVAKSLSQIPCEAELFPRECSNSEIDKQ